MCRHMPDHIDQGCGLQVVYCEICKMIEEMKVGVLENEGETETNRR